MHVKCLVAGEGVLEEAAEKVRVIARRSAPWIKGIARVGLASKGAVYGLVGLFAVATALGLAGDAKDFKGAIRFLDELWWGKALLVILGAGLFAYCAWRLLQALIDPENPEPEKKRVFKRIGYFTSTVAHGSLGYFALKKALGLRDDDPDSDESTKHWTAEIMYLPLGEWLIGLAGAGLIVFGLFQVYYGFAGFMNKKLKTGEMSAAEEKGAKISAQYGLLTRGLIFGLIGGFLVKSAFDLNPKEAKGIKGALDFLEAQPIGSGLLAALGFGLVAYSVLMFLQARYRRIKAG
jgi:hypothetical protein